MENSATKTPQQLLDEIRALAVQYAELTGSKIAETGQPMLFGNGGLDTRLIGGKPHIGLNTFFGVVTTQMEPAGLLNLIGRALLIQSDAIQVQLAQAEAVQVKGAGGVQ